MSRFIYKNDLDNIPIIIDQLKELIIESERVSEKLDSAISEKEQLLEDINALVEDKLNRLHNIINSDTKEKNIRERIKELHLQGLTPAEIAKKLQISITEVNLVIKIL
jgi:DNA-directed RNA polymerase specialized sigma24 family protein